MTTLLGKEERDRPDSRRRFVSLFLVYLPSSSHANARVCTPRALHGLQNAMRLHHPPKTCASCWSSSSSAFETRLPNPRKPPAASATARARPRTLSRRLVRSVGESSAARADV